MPAFLHTRADGAVSTDNLAARPQSGRDCGANVTNKVKGHSFVEIGQGEGDVRNYIGTERKRRLDKLDSTLSDFDVSCPRNEFRPAPVRNASLGVLSSISGYTLAQIAATPCVPLSFGRLLVAFAKALLGFLALLEQ
jgi:hypothetical protein